MAGSQTTKRINLALQGGGAHGAFTWGVLDYLLEDGRISIEGLSGTSAGAMNATVYAFGQMCGGRDGARQALRDFWRDISNAGGFYTPAKGWSVADWQQSWFGGTPMGSELSFGVFDALSRVVSPYQYNPLDINPLRDVLDKSVDFDALKSCQTTKLFIGATNVRSGKVKVFETSDISLDAVMASACLPYLFKAVEIDGEAYWDGGYMGNPALFPFFYKCDSRDVLIVHVNPMERREIPTTASAITNRINEISFNGSLLKELRAINFVQKLLNEEWLKPEFAHRLRNILVHSIRSDDALQDLSVASKFHVGWPFLCELRDRGREAAQLWLEVNFDTVGDRSSVDLSAEFLAAGLDGEDDGVPRY